MDKRRTVSIRGAVTASNDKESIKRAAAKLADKLYFKNGLTDADVVNITISMTKDLTAYSAATAIREHGYAAPLFSAVEPDIDGGLGGCIRLMIVAQTSNPVRNIYLGAARALRRDLTDVYAIALDGPSGAGKSTVAKLVAAKLGIVYLDTGALYRALGLKCIKRGVATNDEKAVENCLKDASVDIKYDGGIQRVLLDGVDVSGEIRTPAVSMAASESSAIPFVRQKLLGLQRDIAASGSVILDGRDIGTVVLPNAEFKYFLTASADVRAKRRFDELRSKGQSVVYEDVLKDVIERDRNDSTRAVAPLKQAYDARAIDSDNLSAEQVAAIIVDEVNGDIK